jgi:hypothetical protein
LVRRRNFPLLGPAPSPNLAVSPSLSACCPCFSSGVSLVLMGRRRRTGAAAEVSRRSGASRVAQCSSVLPDQLRPQPLRRRRGWRRERPPSAKAARECPLWRRRGMDSSRGIVAGPLQMPRRGRARERARRMSRIHREHPRAATQMRVRHRLRHTAFLLLDKLHNRVSVLLRDIVACLRSFKEIKLGPMKTA